MCLTTNTRFCNLADESIFVYKVLAADEHTDQLYAPLYNMRYYCGQRTPVVPVQARRRNNTLSSMGFEFVMEGGYHSFRYLVDACEAVIKEDSLGLTKLVFLGVIPRGSRYYTGRDCEINKGFVSETIVIPFARPLFHRDEAKQMKVLWQYDILHTTEELHKQLKEFRGMI